MNQIQQITSLPLQTQTLFLDDGTSFTLTLYFRPMQLGWFITSLVYGDILTINEMRVVNSPNMLNQWRNKIPFGLGCFSTNNREPSLLEDFESGASKLYILSEDEVAEYAGYLRGG